MKSVGTVYFKAMKTREKLLWHTTRIMRSKGYYGTGIREILEAANVPKGSLYHHFPMGKDDLVAEALEEEMVLFANYWKSLSPKGRQQANPIDGFWKHTVDETRASPIFLWILVGLETIQANPKVARAAKRAYVQFRQILQQGISEDEVDSFIINLCGQLIIVRITS